MYGCSQSLPIPFADFKFVSDEEKLKIDWENVNLFEEIGYFVEVDLEYPLSIHQKTLSFPLCPENVEITFDMLSPYQKFLLKEIYNKTTYKSKKLTATFFPKTKIVLHALNLQLYVKLGMMLTKVHRVIQFRQAPIMKSWIDYCTSKRSKATSDFEKNLWKLFANSVGSFIYNIFVFAFLFFAF